MKEDAVRILEPDTADRRPAPRIWVVVLLVTGVAVAFTLWTLVSSYEDLAAPPSIALTADEPTWGVTIETVLDVRGPFGSVASGTFVASGEAVDDGELCTGGFFTTLGTQSGETESGFWFEYEMFCSGRSGSFLLRISSQDKRLFDSPVAFRSTPVHTTWEVAGGTRKFQTLVGRGATRAVFESDRCIIIPRLGTDPITCGFWVRTYSGEVARP